MRGREDRDGVQMKPKALDLFCGAGGAAMGLHRAGFDVTGVDIKPQPRYPFQFVQADAMTFPLEGYDLVWASPPCQRYSRATVGSRGTWERHLDLLPSIIERLEESGCAYVVENVHGAPLGYAFVLCGSMFGLNLWRHRWFRTRPFLLSSMSCRHDLCPRPINPYNSKSYQFGITGPRQVAYGKVMGIDWMQYGPEISEAIPPAYSEWIGRQMIEHVRDGVQIGDAT